MSAPETAPAAAEQASTVNGSTELDGVLDAITSPASEPANPIPPHWQKVLGEQAQELGELRKWRREMEQVKTAPVEEPVTAGFDWSEPDTSLTRLTAKMKESLRAELRAEIEPEIAPARNAALAHNLMNESMLAQTLLSNPEVVESLKQIQTNPDLASRYMDLSTVRMKAALFDQANERAVMRARGAAAAKANRPENGGIVVPATPVTTAIPKVAPEPPKNMQEAVAAFGAAIAAHEGARNL